MINLYNMDCLEAMKRMEDEKYDLAIVDPPYGIKGGINDTRKTVNSCKSNSIRNYKFLTYDKKPTKEYFLELQRISKNQIIFGGNYFTDFLQPTRCFVVWDKMTYIPTMSQVELAWTSFDRHTRYVKINSNQKNRIHINQKPVQLYSWILTNYAKKEDKILDTHLGSGSIAIACHDMGFSLDGYELDTDYYENAIKRLEKHQQQLKLFT